MYCYVWFFFVKQKTADEMRISDWSSEVCSSDLTRGGLDWTDKFAPLVRHIAALDLPPCLIDGEIIAYGRNGNPDFSALQAILKRGHGSQDEENGRASCRERVCKYV